MQTQRTLTWCRWFFGIGVVGGTAWLLYASSSILWPFIAAAVTAYVGFPVVRWIERRLHISRAWVLVGGYGLVGSLLWVATSQFIIPFWHTIESSDQALPALVQAATQPVVQLLPLLSQYGVQESDVTTQWQTWLGQIGVSIGTWIPLAVQHLATVITLGVTYLVLTGYFLAQGDGMIRACVAACPTPARHAIDALRHDMHNVLQAYLRSQVLMIGIMTVCFAIPLNTLGIPYAWFLAFMAGCLEVIPIVGPFIATLSIAAIAATQGEYPFLFTAPLAVAFVVTHFLAVRIVQDQFIAPRVYGKSVAVHPVLLIFAVLAGGVLYGPAGMMMATPFAAMIGIALRHVWSWMKEDGDPPTPDQSDPLPSHPQTVASDRGLPSVGASHSVDGPQPNAHVAESW